MKSRNIRANGNPDVIRAQALYAQEVLPDDNEQGCRSVSLSHERGTVIMDILDYIFWIVTIQDVDSLYRTLHTLPVLKGINRQPLAWDGHSLMTYTMALPRSLRKNQLLSILSSYGIDASLPQRNTGYTVLTYAATQNNPHLTAYFSRFDTYTNTLLYSTTANHSTPLHCAIYAGADDAAKVLVESPVLVNRRDKLGDTSLHIAVTTNNEEIVKALITVNAHPVILNAFLEDPLIKAFNGRNGRIIRSIIKSPLYTQGILRHQHVIRSRMSRIQKAFRLRFPERHIAYILEPELKSNDTSLCSMRDSQRKNIIYISIDRQYYNILGYLLDHFKDAYERKLPMWKSCNVHEPNIDNVYPLERYVHTFNRKTQNVTNLRKLMTAMVPVDGTSVLMHAIRHKGIEFVLSNFIPFGLPGVLLSDLKFNAYEIGIESWGHNALTLASNIPKGGGREISRGLLNLMALGLIGNVSEIAQAFFQSLSTTSYLRDSALIHDIAHQAAPAVQLWYCIFTRIRPIESTEVTFLTNSLPLTFPGFSPRIPCSPIEHHVQLVLKLLRERQIPRVDVIEALIRASSIQWNPGYSIQKALRHIGQTKL